MNLETIQAILAKTLQAINQIKVATQVIKTTKITITTIITKKIMTTTDNVALLILY